MPCRRRTARPPRRRATRIRPCRHCAATSRPRPASGPKPCAGVGGIAAARAFHAPQQGPRLGHGIGVPAGEVRCIGLQRMAPALAGRMPQQCPHRILGALGHGHAARGTGAVAVGQALDTGPGAPPGSHFDRVHEIGHGIVGLGPAQPIRLAQRSHRSGRGAQGGLHCGLAQQGRVAGRSQVAVRHHQHRSGRAVVRIHEGAWPRRCGRAGRHLQVGGTQPMVEHHALPWPHRAQVT